MIHIYFFFLYGYFKDHKSRILFSLCGISLGIALFFTTQVNSWRAEESIIDAESGYSDSNYLGQFVSNQDGLLGEEVFLRELYYLVPNEINLEPLLIEDAFFDVSASSVLRFPMIGKDLTIVTSNQESIPDTKDSEVKKFILSQALYQRLFEKHTLISLSLCNKSLQIRKTETVPISQDGNFIITDIQFLQIYCGKKDKIHRVLLTNNSETDLSEFPSDQILALSEKYNWKWETREFVRDRSGKALGSLKINLTIVSLVSVLISFFMVASTFSGIYLARRKEFGILLSLGNSRTHNLFLFFSQGILLGMIGSIIGVCFGTFLLNFDFLRGRNTITDGSQMASYREIPSWIYLSAISIGIFGAAISSLFSSLRSYFIKPIALIRESDTTTGFKSLNRLFLFAASLGILFIFLGVIIGFLPSPKSLLPGLTGVALVIIGFVLIFPLSLSFTISVSIRFLERFFFFPTFRIAWEEIKLEPLQNSLTSATILLATSLVFTLTSLTESYEQTLTKWVDTDNQFDYSIINISKLTSGLPGVPISLQDQLNKNPIFKQIEPFIIKTKFPIGDNYYTLHVYPFPSNKNEVIVSSNFCYLETKCKGEKIEIQTEKHGKVFFDIISVRDHFFSERGTIMMNVENYQNFFTLSELNSLRVSFPQEIPENQQIDILERELKSFTTDLKILDKNSLKALYLDGMREVFSILGSLKHTAILISLLALLTSLIYNIKEKSKLIATLQAIGLSQFQLFKLIFFQSLFFIFMGLSMGIINSLILSPLVIYGINRNAFGWLLDFNYSFELLFYYILASPIMALLVSVYPFLEARKKSLREALNYE